MFKKKWLLVFLSIIIIILSVFFLFPRPAEEPTPTVQPEPESESEEIEEAEEETEEEPEQEDNESITQNIKDIVQEAFNFFQQDTHIVAIGDSLTQGVGDETGNQGYVGILEERLNDENYAVTFDNFGKRGNRTDHLLKRLEENPEITEALEKTDIILLTIGANDLMQIMKDNFMNLTEEPFMEEMDPYGERLNQILETMHEANPDATIYLLGFFNPFEQYFSEIEELNQIVTLWNNKSLQIANQYDYVSFIPMQDIFQDVEDDVYSEDNFHPNRRGYEIIADRVISFLQNKIEENQE